MTWKKKSKWDILIRSSILMILSLVITNLLANTTFDFGGYAVLNTVFIYPFAYFFANVITKYYGWKKTVIVILGAIGFQSLFFIISNMIMDTGITDQMIVGSVGAFAISQFTSLALYASIIRQKKVGYFYLVGIYFIALLLDNLTYFSIIGTDYDFGLFYMTIFRTLMAMGLVFIDKRFYPKPKKIIT